MSNNQAEILEKRIIDLSVDIIHKLKHESEIPEYVKTQLGRSITSIGANYAEACNASSKADFRNKIYIAKKEAAESIYWVRIIRGLKEQSDYLSEEYESLYDVVRILQKSISTSLKNDK